MKGSAFLFTITMIFLSSVTTYAMPTYDIIDLGSVSASSINNNGQVVGKLSTTDNQQHAFIYDNGTIIDLVAGGANDITNTGQVVGYSATTGHAFLYSNGIMTDLGSIETNPNKDWSTANAINDNGQIVGETFVPDSGDEHGFLYDNGTMTDLGTYSRYESKALDINNSGQVVGVTRSLQSALSEVAFLDNGDGTWIDLGSLGSGKDSWANSINDNGQVVGWSYTDNGGYRHAFLYSDGQMIDLGTFGGNYSYANDINNSGQIVGDYGNMGNFFDAFLYNDGQMIDLNSLIALGTGWSLQSASNINDMGQIIGSGTIDGQTHSYLLSPSWDALVTTSQDYLMNITLGSMFTFDYWWEMGQESNGFNLDILFFSGGKWNSFSEWELNFDGSSTDWKTASFTVPENLKGLLTQIDFRFFDLGAVTDPTVYLRNIASNCTAPVPEPATLLLLGTGLLGLAGFRKKIKK